MDGLGQEGTYLGNASLVGERIDEERRNLVKARYMALDRYPVTDLANDLCRVVGDYLINTDRKRKNRRGKEALEKYHRATGAVIADLMLGFRREKSPLSYRTLSPATFTDGSVSYRNFKSIIDALEGLGLVFRAAQGFYRRETISSGQATRYGINTLLLDIAADFEITPTNIDKHFACELPRTPLVLHSAKERHDWRHSLSRYRPFTGKKRVRFETTDRQENWKPKLPNSMSSSLGLNSKEERTEVTGVSSISVSLKVTAGTKVVVSTALARRTTRCSPQMSEP